MSLEWGKIVQSINWTTVLSLVNFGILLYILKRLLFKPAIEYLDRRRDQIHARITAAQESEARAAELVTEREQEFARAKENSGRVIEEARQRAEQMIAEAKTKAGEEADRVVAEAHRRMAQDRDRMVEELKTAYAEIAVLGVQRVLDREVKIDDHRKLLEQLLSEIDEDALKVGS